MTDRFDLDRYLARIAYEGPLAPTAETLAALHFAHATRIPFENLDILLGRPIRLDLASLQAKLVDARRGGYCYEQNSLFAAVLERLGYRVTRLAARVRYGTERTLARTHALLLVDVQRERWVADVGFGCEGLLLPVPLQAGAPSRQHAWTYRLRTDGDAYVMQSLGREGFRDLYAFTLEPQLPVDFEVPNFYVSTHPESRFVRTLTAQQPGPDVRALLRNRTLQLERGVDVEVHEVEDDEALLAVLAQRFALVFAPGTRFRFEAGS